MKTRILVPIGLMAGAVLMVDTEMRSQSSNVYAVLAATTNTTIASTKSGALTNNIVPGNKAKEATGNDKEPVRTSQVRQIANQVKIQLSPVAKELVKMAESGLEASVLQGYAASAMLATPLTANEIIYLREHGIAAETILALIRRGKELAEKNTYMPGPRPGAPVAYRQTPNSAYYYYAPGSGGSIAAPYFPTYPSYANYGFYTPYYYWWYVSYPFLGYSYAPPRNPPVHPLRLGPGPGVNPPNPRQPWSIPR